MTPIRWSDAAETALGVVLGLAIGGLIITGNNEVDVYCRWKQHRDTVARLAAERGLG